MRDTVSPLRRTRPIAPVRFLVAAIFFCTLALPLTLFAQADDVPPGDAYPLVEEFVSPDGLTITDPDKIAIEDGLLLARPAGEGQQFAYRPIPSFSGNVRITLRGQINDWENNCAVRTGIGDELKSGIMITSGFFGGGCPVQGPLVDAGGVTLNHGSDGCDWLGPWLWVEEAQPYEATLTVVDGLAELTVADAGQVTGTVDYDGVYSMLFAGETGRNISSNYCSVDIDSMTIEPLAGALIASSDLTATVAYPTQIDLSWSHAVENAAVIRIERAEEGRAWSEIATVDGGSMSYADNRTTCGITYLYRTDIHTADGRRTGYSNIARTTTPPCITQFGEDWGAGLRDELWAVYGSPAPHVEADRGPDGSAAFEPNGDGNFHSGILLKRPLDITSGLNIEFSLRGTGTIGEKYSSLGVALTPCTPTDNLEVECRTHLVAITASTETGAVEYRVQHDEPETRREDWTTLDGIWHRFRIHVKPDGLVDFYRNGQQIHRTEQPIDVAGNRLLYLHIGGKSETGDWHLDDLRVTAPAVPAWYVKVVDETGAPVADAQVFADGEPIGRTNQAGLIQREPLRAGTELVALLDVETAPSIRAMHDGWAYTTYLTSIVRAGEELAPHTVTDAGEQRLMLQRDYPLILFNLLVSIEWDATEAYIEQIARAATLASDHLFDLTDGQMAFGNVEIYANAQHWADADIQVSTKNIVRPHAYVGGLLEEDTARIIRIGRGWDGQTGNSGAWDRPEGYRTLIHEFSHYALYLYDEYVAYEFDDNGNVLGEVPAVCPVSSKDATDPEAVRASAMYDGYRATEFSAFEVPGLWSDACGETLHFQYAQQSAWETIVAAYADPLTDPNGNPPVPSRWRVISPIERQTVLAGPDRLPDSLPAWPTVQRHLGEAPEPPRALTVLGPAGGPVANAIVALYRQSGIQVIGQGLTDEAGRLDVYGANTGDTIRAASFDGGFSGDVFVSDLPELVLVLEPVTSAVAYRAALAPDRAIPHMRILAEPSLESGQIDLLFALHNFGEDADLGISISEPGDEVEYAPVIAYSPTTGTYSGQISFAATEQGLGRVRVFGSMADSRVRMQSNYRLQHVVNNRFGEVYSDDGNLHLQIDAGSLPASEAYFVVMPPGAIPGPLPPEMTLLGDPYDITASGALTRLEKPAVLAMHYDHHLLADGGTVADLAIYRWNPAEERWDLVPSDVDLSQGALVGTIQSLGTYALLIPGAAPAAFSCAACRSVQ